MKQAENYTTKEYWVKYYSNANADKELINKICSKYDNLWDKLYASAKDPKTLFEIGAYPGRYLAYVAARYGLEPTGIDFNPDQDTVLHTFELFGLKNGKYLIEDFLKVKPQAKYDLILSNGFIEHFADFQTILDKHADFLKPGGAMLVMIPNKRYLRKWYGYWLDRENLLAHNLKSMSLKTFRDFADRKNLRIVHLDYLGGFAYKVHQRLNFWQKLVYHSMRYLSLKLNPLLSKYPSKYWSGTIIAIFSKPV